MTISSTCFHPLLKLGFCILYVAKKKWEEFHLLPAAYTLGAFLFFYSCLKPRVQYSQARTLPMAMTQLYGGIRAVKSLWRKNNYCTVRAPGSDVWLRIINYKLSRDFCTFTTHTRWTFIYIYIHNWKCLIIHKEIICISLFLFYFEKNTSNKIVL